MEYKLYIDGEFCDAVAGGAIGVRDPALGREFARAPYGSREDARIAIEAAERAYPAWRDRSVYERAGYLRKVANLMRERADGMAEAVTREVGKPLAESKGEVMKSAATLDWSAEEALRHYGEWIPSHTNEKRLFSLRMPVGVCAGIIPWNFPLTLICRKLGPALAVGCTMVVRTASQTPRSAMELFNCVHDAGLPPGTANLITGPPKEQAEEFIENPAIRKISFTGSVEVGKEIMASAARHLKKLSLELGGHSPFIVCPDADVKRAARLAVQGKFRNMGQTCISPSRFFVPKKMTDRFVSECVKIMTSLKIGNGLEKDTQVGPLIDEIRLAAVEALVADIVKKGGKIVCGGKRPHGKKYSAGFFYEPTLATNLNKDMVILHEEPFSPILPVLPYDDLDEAVESANNTPFGLAAYIVTNDVNTMFKVAERLDAGVIGINDTDPSTPQGPFGGMKESGIGREGWRQGLDAYTEVKFLSIGL